MLELAFHYKKLYLNYNEMHLVITFIDVYVKYNIFYIIK